MENDTTEPLEEECCHNGCQNCVLYKRSLTFKELRSCRIVSEQLRYDLLSPTCFKPFILTKVEPITFHTNVYEMKPFLDTTTVHGFLPYIAGQHLSLCVRVNDLNDDPPSNLSSFLTRSFTIISLNYEHKDCSFQVLIKLYENNVTSNFLRNLKVGNITYWKGPFGNYHYQSNSYCSLIMICMGTGIAPMYPVIKEILFNENDETKIKLMYGCKNSSEIILRNELRDLNSYWNFKCTYYLSEEVNMTNKKYNEEFILSRILGSHISNVINDLSSFFLICGSSKFSDDMKQILTKLEVDDNMIHVF